MARYMKGKPFVTTNTVRDSIKRFLLGGVLGIAIFAAAWFLFGRSGKEDTSAAQAILGDIYVCNGCGKEYIDHFPSPWEGLSLSNASVTVAEDIGRETSYNDSIDGATPVSMYQYVTGNLSSWDDVDIYRFTVDTPGSVVIPVFFDGSSGDYAHRCDYVIYGTDGATVLSSGSGPIEYGVMIFISVYDLKPGTYYLKISFASDENTFVEGYSDSDYHIFIPACAEQTDMALIAAPTCSQTGVVYVACSESSLLLGEEPLEPLDHIWSQWKPVAESFFGPIWGNYSRVCAFCGAEETSKLWFHFLDEKPKLDPDAVTVTETWTEVETASCASGGFVKTVCSVCGNVEVESKEATGHTYGEWVTSRAATCSVEGERSRACTACGHVETETLDHIPHVYGEAVYISGSILDAPIVSQKTCTECGYVDTVESGWFWWIRPVGIVLGVIAGILILLLVLIVVLTEGNTPIEKAATVASIVILSGAVEGLVITILTMVISSHVGGGDDPFLFLLVPPTCFVVIIVTTILVYKSLDEDLDGGIIVFIAIRFVISLGISVMIFLCFGGSNEDRTESTGHTYGKWEIIRAATCSAEGQRSRTCTACGDVETEILERTSHNYGKWEIIRAATCSAEGERSRTCTVCGNAEMESLERVPHTFGKAVRVSGSILDAPIVSQKTCMECGYVSTVESGWSRWVLPAIIVFGGVATVGILFFALCVIRKQRRRVSKKRQYLFSTKFTCPFCIREYDKSEVLYVCSDCGKSSQPVRFEKGPIECKTPGCSGLATLRKCPSCGQIIPETALETPNLPFSIVGVSNSGKTNYITVMLHELGKPFGLRLVLGHQTKETLDCQNENYHRIYEEHTRPESTQAGEITPQIWYIKNLMKKRGSKVPTYTFTIFDGAGEDYENNLNPSSTACRYINASKAIILVVDPLVLPKIRSGGVVDHDVLINSLGGYEGEAKNAKDVINSVATYIKTARGIKATQMLDIPVAVVLTKFDTLINHKAFGSQALIRNRSLTVRDGKVDMSEIKQVDQEIRNWLYQIEEGAFIDTLDSHFKEYYFFGVSSYGAPPKDAYTLSDEIRPHRVLDPILWLFKREKFID